MIERLMEILDKLIKGNIIINDNDRANMSREIERLLSTERHTEIDVSEMNLIIQIANIMYNNTDTSVLFMEDGVYDILLECYKKYNPNYQIGAVPIQFDSNGEPTVGQTSIFPVKFADPEYIQDSMFIYDDPVFAFPPFDPRFYNPKVREDASDNITKRNVNVPHGYPKLVGTLDKCKFVMNKQAKDRGVFDDLNVTIFERDFLNQHLSSGIINSEDITLILELKYDGISVEADVTNEVLGARSRGDANNDIAADLTPILKGYEFPLAPEIPLKETFGMKFEAIMTYIDLHNISALRGKPYNNARSAIVGLFGAGDAAKYRDFITLVPLATSLNMDRLTEIEFMNKYYNSGVPLNYTVITGNYYTILYQLYRFVEEAEYIRQFMPFLYDGVVVSYLDETIREKLGRVNSVNKYSVAIKFNPLKRQAIFTGYTFNVGQNGVVTPMLHYTPVEFYGGIHTKSTGHSYARFNALSLKIGDIVDLEYTNDVMPYLSKSVNTHNDQNPNQIEPFITVCPYCSGPITIADTGKTALCTNINCHARQIARMTNMFKKLNIKDFAEESLIAIKAESLYDLTSISLEDAIAALGEVNGKKFIDRVVELNSANIYDYKIVGSIGFSDVAIETWKKILNKVPFSVIADLKTPEEELYELMIQIKGIGPNTANTIISERNIFINDLLYIMNMPNVICSYGEKTNKSIRFTGIRDTEVESYLCSLGYDANGLAGVTKSTDILIVPYPGYTSAKTGKVGDGTMIVDIGDFKANMNKYL